MRIGFFAPIESNKTETDYMNPQCLANKFSSNKRLSKQCIALHLPDEICFPFADFYFSVSLFSVREQGTNHLQ
jgi:hypothetical protein